MPAAHCSAGSRIKHATLRCTLFCLSACRALLEEALQLERQLHIALLADRLTKQEEAKQQEEEGEEGQAKQQDADEDAAAADSLAIPGGRSLACSISGCLMAYLPNTTNRSYRSAVTDI